MADATSDGGVTLELHGFLADRLAALGRRRGTRVAVDVRLDGACSVEALLTRLAEHDARYTLLFDAEAGLRRTEQQDGNPRRDGRAQVGPSAVMQHDDARGMPRGDLVERHLVSPRVGVDGSGEAAHWPLGDG